MGSIPSELSLDCRPTYIPKTISEVLGDLSTIDNVSERLLKLDDFVNRLEQEMGKIDAFKRELPLCMLLLNDAIAALKEESIQFRKSSVEPVLEEFIPLKKSCDEDEKTDVNKEKDQKEKMNWMSSVQLWNSNQCSNTNFHCKQKKPAAETKKRTEEDNLLVTDDHYQACKSSRSVGKAFMAFKGYSNFPVSATKKDEELPVSGLSLVTPGMKNLREELVSGGLSSKSSFGRAIFSSASSNVQQIVRTGQQTSQQQSTRKQRRCWSPDLHRRFVNALQQLGGSQVATPKQIRELMQVDGLTNDEVKSHLQKYRLHTRRLPSTNGNHTNRPAAALGGGLWMPKDQYSERESTKQNNSQSGSPQGPLQLTGNIGGTSSPTGGESLEEEEEDGKSESSYSWKSHIHVSGKDDV